MKRCTVANCTKCPPDRNDHTAVNSPQLRNGTSPHGTQLGSVHHHPLPSSSVGTAGHIGHHPIGSNIIGGSLSHPLHGPSGPNSGPTHGQTHGPTHGPSHGPSHGLPHVQPHGQSHLPHHRVRQSPTGLPSGLPPHSMHHQTLPNSNRQNDASFKPVK